MLIGHPEHDLLFIATQVARAAGLKEPSRAVCSVQSLKEFGRVHRLSDLPYQVVTGYVPKTPRGRCYTQNTTVFTEGQTYKMLMRGNAPQSEQFRTWVTEEVLPSIRKTGSYNVNESTTETGQQFAGELAALSDAVTGLLKQNATILGMLRRRPILLV